MMRTGSMVAAWMVAFLLSAAVAAAGYQGPSDLVATPDGQTLFVLCEDAAQVAVVDVASGKVTRTIACPAPPTGLTLCPQGKMLFVTCAKPEGTVAVIDAATGEVKSTLAAGHSARGPVVSPDAKVVYVCNRFNDDVSVIEVATGKTLARVPTIREPYHAAISPDGKTLLVANLLPNNPCDSYDVASEITAIDTATNQATNIRLPNGSTSVYEISLSHDGKFAYAVHILARYQMPTTQLERGWMNTNAMSIIDVAAKKLVNTVLLDDIDLGAANPHAVAVTPDGKTICVTHSGTHEVSVIDAPGMHAKLNEVPNTIDEAKAAGRYDNRGTYSSIVKSDIPNDLAFLVGLRRRIGLESSDPWAVVDDSQKVNGPRGLEIIGRKAYVAVYFSDLVAVVDLDSPKKRPVTLIELGPRPQLTKIRRGEIFFHDAALCFQHWQSCASCHPDARVDALNWDLMNDGMGTPKNNRSMLLTHKTPPSMAEGVRGDAETAVRSGITHIQFAVRPDEDAQAIDEYLKALVPVPSPALVNGQLSPSAQRGKAIFFSEKINCAKCHPEPLYTDLQMHDVKSRGKYDRRDDFDTPTLIECWRTGPYMHDGHWVTLEALFKEGKHGKVGGGDIDALTEQEMADLVEFVRSL
ncbi:MAG: beta-propeller fold lactonase family protein [Thermoguttaceae bacterium]